MIEMIINDLRMESISYISAYKKAKNNRANYVKSMVEYYRKKQTLSDMEKLMYNDFILEYDTIIEANALKIMKRDKILSQAYNEKPSKYFCNLEKDKSAEKFIPKIKCKDLNGNERILTLQEDIEKEVTNFYKNLYNNKDHLLSGKSLHEFLETGTNDFYPSINDIDNIVMSEKISMAEMKTVLENAKNGSAPGQTGLTFEFYRKFWDRLVFF